MDADTVAWSDGECSVRIGDTTLRARCGEVTARGSVRVVARPERLELLEHGSQRENCLVGMVERSVYVGASRQVMVRLPIGAAVQVSIANTGGADEYSQGTPICVHVPPEALRVLSDSAPRPPADEGAPAGPPAVPAGQRS
jgi:hypothetical protein